MCMKVFALHRCLAPSNGGCDGYYAEYVEDQSCNRMMHGGLPQLDCRTVWAGFEEEVSAKVNHRDDYAKKSKGLCPQCQHNRQIAYIQGQAELERNGEFSDRVQALVADLTRKAELGHTEFMLRVYHELWDAAQLLVAGLSNKTDVAWDGIEAALWTHFGVDGMTLAPVRAMVASLREVRRELLGHVRTNVKEMAVALVGPNESWDVDLEIGGYIDEEWRRQRQVAVEASRQRAWEEEQREEEHHRD
ncbi:hypothetical protein ColTof4_03201 [Colletotrichum tofieldiae]|uniref:Uncharacterized protein n=1 Tax=Colletotrichum tofieldiae TaxID=708197 RepID=A0A166TYR2_9PEZI|nr:hypothetical protein CT0861_12087 [Colletotrichum tofieldiae]GKT66046.1 hypothetical protein ColTof3_13385 [Colletotrichum tofieldiae]GKT70778.1 hypothetical protein ColTof4_03201 [Colletotrichum tofieldiae]